MSVIKVQHLVKDYGLGRGVFDISFEVPKGKIFGFVGTNGAGKTTTIRNIMGFIKPDSGNTYINGLDSWLKSSQIKNYVGYVPGEIAFPDLRTGKEFLTLQAKMLGLKNTDYANFLIKELQLNVMSRLKTMSKGTKQKTAIVNALMADREILILDEPTTGLDPLMRSVFVDILKEENSRGKTIFISSHIFEELEPICDYVALIKDGKIVDIANMDDIRNHGVRTFKIAFNVKLDFEKFQKSLFNVKDIKPKYHQLLVDIDINDINLLFQTLNAYDVKFIAEVKYNLEQYFDSVFKGEAK
ncbi:MAG: ATP-binding cassette domain-containing protein [Clostridiales bacterium]|nr:ATP-binding cassette domain-containing protein [Clostridiales bacterium]